MKDWHLWHCRYVISESTPITHTCVVATDTWSAYHARSVAAQVLGAPAQRLDVIQVAEVVGYDSVHYYGKTEHGTYERWVDSFPSKTLKTKKQ